MNNDQLKTFSLILLCLQNTALVIVMKMALNSTEFLSTTVVVVTELVKVLICIGIIFFTQKQNAILYLKKELTNKSSMIKMSVPAGIYALQNNIQYVALRNLSPATYQVTYQLKILTTAALAYLFLKQKILKQQWLALVTLTIGVIIVQLDKYYQSIDINTINDNNPSDGNLFIGLIAVLTGCITSGFAGIYFEKILKGSKTSVWMRNIQLGLFGAIFGYIYAIMYNGDEINQNGFTYGYNSLVYGAISLQAAGGLTVAAVIKYADNVAKCLAVSVAIILSCILSVIFLILLLLYHLYLVLY